MTEDPGTRPIALGDHPGLPALLRALPALQVPVLPRDYARIEQVFPVGHRLPWSEARDLLADLLAKDPGQHQSVAEAFQRFIPPPVLHHRQPPADGQGAGRTSEATTGQPLAGEKKQALPDAIESTEPPRSWIWLATVISAVVLILVAASLWLLWHSDKVEPGRPQQETAQTESGRKKPGQLPSDPLPRFHAWVPVVQIDPDPIGPLLWPPALLLLSGILGVGWLLQRWRDLKQPVGRLPRPRLQPGGQRVPSWRPDQWQLPQTLDPAQRREIVWGVQRFTAEQTTERLDSGATVTASARADIPRLCFEPSRREREVWLWQDTRLRSPEAAALADELAALLTRAGLPLCRAGFSAIPDPIWFDGRTPVSPFDLSAAAREALVVIFSDGQAWREALLEAPLEDRADPGVGGRRAQRLLHELRGWQRVCLVNLDGHTGPDPLGLERVAPDDLPAWLAERPYPSGTGHAPDQCAGTITEAQARLWAAACALPDLPIAERQAAELYDRLGLPPAWRLPPPPLAKTGAGQLHFPAADRRRLLRDLADRLWQTRGKDDDRSPHGPAERPLGAAIAYWKAELAKLDAADTQASGPADPRPWKESSGQHQARITALLLDLWSADDRVRAAAVAALYALYRLYAGGPDGQRSSNTEKLQKLIRRRLGELSAQGLDAKYADAIRLPWRWDRLGERPGDSRGTARARLLQMGYAGAEPDSRPRPFLPAALALGAGAGLAAVGLAVLIDGLLQLPEPTFTQIVHTTPLEPDSKLAEHFAGQARVAPLDGRLRAIGPKLLLERTLPPNRSATVHWCWSGVGPPDADSKEPCAKLRDTSYESMVINQLLTDADDDTVLLRTGSLAEPIRACAPDWPALSVAVIDAPPWRPESQSSQERIDQTVAARRLAIRLLDSGAVDLAIVGPHWRKEAEQLAQRRDELDSQWLFFTPFDGADPPRTPLLPPEQGRHQAAIAAHYEALAGHLREQIDGALDLHTEVDRLPDDIGKARVLSGRPRLWGGPAIESIDLGGGVRMDLVQVCPGTFTMGATDLAERRLPGIVAETLGRFPADLDDATRIDEATLGEGTRTRLREALETLLGVSLNDVTWNAVADLKGAVDAVSEWLEWGVERPAHPVLMDGFQIARTETTEGQLRALRSDLLQEPTGDGRQPAARNDWDEASAVCEKAGGDLPSEAQWEYAARGGSRTAWSGGDDASETGDYAWFSDNSGSRARPVADKRANPLGLRDMHGNLWEWNGDCYSGDVYEQRAGRLELDPVADPAGCRQRVLRGGSFDLEPRGLRSADRYWFEPEYRRDRVGFRCVRSGARSVAPSTP